MRCRMRKQLFIQRNKVCDFSLILAIAGLLFVIIDAELTALSSTTHITKGSQHILTSSLLSRAHNYMPHVLSHQLSCNRRETFL
ncbi:hypothetical protein COOONC_11196 [Cooperia oncophora]